MQGAGTSGLGQQPYYWRGGGVLVVGLGECTALKQLMEFKDDVDELARLESESTDCTLQTL